MSLAHLRQLGPDDRAEIVALWVAAWTLAMPTIDFAARRAWFEGHLDALLATGAIVVVDRRPCCSGVAGFLTLHPGTGTIDQLAVAPASGGRGLARSLLDEAKRLSPNGLSLSVNQTNTRALALYARAGFVVTQETVNARSGLPVFAMAWRPDQP